MGKALWVGVGGAIGVAIGILFAPRKGSETRRAIAERTEPVQTVARKAASKAGDAIAPATDKAGEWLPVIGGKNGDVKMEEPVGKASSS